jgi:hypothetical protein
MVGMGVAVITPTYYMNTFDRLFSTHTGVEQFDCFDFLNCAKEIVGAEKSTSGRRPGVPATSAGGAPVTMSDIS